MQEIRKVQCEKVTVAFPCWKSPKPPLLLHCVPLTLIRSHIRLTWPNYALISTNKDFYHAQGFLGTILPIMHDVPGLDQRGTDESWEWYQYRRNLESEKKLNNVVWSWSRSASWLTSTGILETALEKYSNDQVYNSCFFNCSDTHRFADLFGKIPELGRFLVQNILIKFFLDEFDLQQHVLNTNLWKKERDTTGWATEIMREKCPLSYKKLGLVKNSCFLSALKYVSELKKVHGLVWEESECCLWG